MHTTDIYILDSHGHEVWGDVRVTAVPLHRPVGPALREAGREPSVLRTASLTAPP